MHKADLSIIIDNPGGNKSKRRMWFCARRPTASSEVKRIYTSTEPEGVLRASGLPGQAPPTPIRNLDRQHSPGIRLIYLSIELMFPASRLRERGGEISADLTRLNPLSGVEFFPASGASRLCFLR